MCPCVAGPCPRLPFLIHPSRTSCWQDGTFSWRVSLRGVASANKVHLHRAPDGQVGPLAVVLAPAGGTVSAVGLGLGARVRPWSRPWVAAGSHGPGQPHAAWVSTTTLPAAPPATRWLELAGGLLGSLQQRCGGPKWSTPPAARCCMWLQSSNDLISPPLTGDADLS